MHILVVFLQPTYCSSVDISFKVRLQLGRFIVLIVLVYSCILEKHIGIHFLLHVFGTLYSFSRACLEGCITLWWACLEGCITLWWACLHGCITLWWACLEGCITLWWACLEGCVTLWWACLEGCITLWWACKQYSYKQCVDFTSSMHFLTRSSNSPRPNLI